MAEAQPQMGGIRGIINRLVRNFYSYAPSERASKGNSFDKYKKEIQNKGINGLKSLLSKDLKNWSDVELHAAVIGSSGSGKSTFINSIRGLRAKDQGAAKVGSNETTTKCQPYKHPLNDKFVIWDLPGVGTPSFPRESYLERVSYDKYDFFIIMTKDRFTENDEWLVLEIQRLKKTFFFVRANIDRDIQNAEEDVTDYDEKRFLQEIRSRTIEELEKKRVVAPKVFLVNNRRWKEYDFGKLQNVMLASCNSLKKDSLALSLSAVTLEVIDEKNRVLKSRVFQVALKVTCSSEEYAQRQIFQDEIKFYQQQFSIDETTMNENKDILSLTKDNLKEFTVVFDAGQTSMKTPTAMREETALWDRFKDFFRLTKENKLLFKFCTAALENNLEVLYQKSRSFYDEHRVKQLINAIQK